MYFQYYEPPFGAPESHRQGLVATLARDVRKTRDLLRSVGHLLGFPAHYGKNFDAFWDCVRDLPAKPKLVALVHRDVPAIPGEDLETYLEILMDAVAYWRKHTGEHVFEVWFPEECRGRIEALMKDIPPPDDEELE